MFKRKQHPYSNTFIFHNHNINYQVLGKGKPVVFVHGAFTDSYPYKKALQLLAEDYTVYISDLPGFGGSDVIKGKHHTSDLFSETLTAFLKENKLQKAPIVALSMGVVVAIQTALDDEIEGDLVLVAAPGKADPGWKTQFFANLPRPLRRMLVSTNLGRRTLLLPTASANTGTGVQTQDMRLEFMSYTSNEAMVDSNYLKDMKEYGTFLSKVPNKMIFIYGEHDRMKHTKLDLIEEFIEIPNVGHNVFVESPEEIVKVLRSLL